MKLQILFCLLLSSAQAREATYEVPVNARRLLPFSKFAVKDVEVRNQAGPLGVSFTFPKELAGAKKLKIALRETGKSISGGSIMEGQFASGHCAKESAETGSFDCDIKYKKKKIEEVLGGGYRKDVRKVLWDKGAIGYFRRLRVVTNFMDQAEPNGVLRVK